MQNELGLVTYDTITSIDCSFGQITHLQGDSFKFENELFFYHGDHLSSTQMITDANGAVQQQVLYAPFGEVISEYNAYWHQGKVPDYLFNAKEKDEESGMYYYSARYYAPPVFISRDPLFEKYPFMSPYAYCANNPVIIVDPDGRVIVIPISLKGSERRQIMRQLNRLTNDRLSYNKSIGQVTISRTGSGKKVKGTELISRLVSSSKTITIDYQNSLGRFRDGIGNKAKADNYTKAGDGTGSGGVVSFDPSSKIKPLTENPKTGHAEEKSRPKRIGLGHELIHGLHYVDGDWTPSSDQTTHTYTDGNGNPQTQTIKTEEARTVGVGGNKLGDITENDLRKENNQNKRVAY
jgi:RHS repeat-associated protein